MFDILLGRKFSNKCKHSVKYIKCRIETIRKKKQVMVRYLKKDVADLLAAGHDANAFGRFCMTNSLILTVCAQGSQIDALIVEINHSSCYDMIEHYCGCLLEHLSTMRMERDCPQEAMEAVATLIFAAARFSDLPELADLRTVFTKRYGTRMETCIDKELVEKIQKKSFSKDRKLQLMDDIAQEFSVNWNSNMFENKISNKSAPSHGNPMKHQLITKESEKEFPMSAVQKRQIQSKEQKDCQTSPTNANIYAHDSTEIIVKMTADESAHAKSDHPDKKASVKTKFNQNERHINDSLLEGNPRCSTKMVHDGIGLVAIERQPSTEVVHKSFKAIDTIPPPYTKLIECSKETIADNAQDRWPNKPENLSVRRSFNSQPPYRKPSINKTPDDTNYVKPTDNEKSTEGKGNDHSKNKMPKDELFDDDAVLVSQIQAKQVRESTRTDGIQGELYDQQRFILKQTPGSCRRHGSRRAVEATKDGGLDKEEEIIDKLLMKYSKKGINNEPRKTRPKMRGDLKEPIADAEAVPENPDEGKHHSNISTPISTRGLSLPRELTSPAENGVKSRTRAGSMQTGRIPLRQPENEKLAAWIAQH